MKKKWSLFAGALLALCIWSGLGEMFQMEAQAQTVSLERGEEVFYEGYSTFYYYIDGEEPILTDHVTMEAEWEHLPYVNDGTCVFKDAIFRFCGKEFHFEGKWGCKGFTPRVEKHGQSQIFGTWYEGKIPYRHRVYLTFGENMEAYDVKLKELGFDVK